MLDFQGINDRAMAAFPTLLKDWLPAGQRRGREWVVGDLAGAKGESCSINIDTGIWKDFATGVGGSDPISLYAAINNLRQAEAAERLAEKLGAPTEPPKKNGAVHTTEEPAIIMPVPKNAPSPDDHPKMGAPSMRHYYRDQNGLILGIIARFNLADGKKSFAQQTFSEKGWRWKSMPKPRPLYGLDRLAANPEKPVLLVEGEVCADVAVTIMPAYVAMTWPGGGQAIGQVDWAPLYGRKILIWPDRDRHKYPHDHAFAGEEIPYDDQVGTITGRKIAETLAPHCPEIKILDTRDLPNDGDDIKDRVASGWSTKEIISWAKQNVSVFNPNAASFAATPVPEEIIDIKDPLNMSRLLLASRFAAPNGPLRHYGNCWYRWTGTHYPEVEANLIRARTYSWLAACSHHLKGGLTKVKPNREMVSVLMDALAAETYLPSTVKAPLFLDARPLRPQECIALKNGILELRTRTLHPHTDKFWSHNCVPYEYDPLAPVPTNWLAFLDSVWGYDPEAIDCLQEIIGYLLTTDTSFQKMFMLVGPKRAGKGTIGAVITRLIGQENTCSPTLSSLNGDFALEPLIGKQLAQVTDARIEGQTSMITERLLSISGEDPQTINRKNLTHWNGKLHARFLISTNVLPRFGDSSGAITSRFIILVMQRSFFNKEDKNLINRLLPELPGIFNWAMDGLGRLMARGRFQMPSSSRDMQEEFEELSAPIGGFIRDMCIVGTDQRVECQDLFQAWTKWCRENGRDGHGTLQTFARDLKAQEASVATVRVRKFGGSSAHFNGIGLVPNTPSYSDIGDWEMNDD